MYKPRKLVFLISILLPFSACSFLKEPDGIKEASPTSNLKNSAILKQKSPIQRKAFQFYQKIYSLSQSHALSSHPETLPCFAIALQHRRTTNASVVLPLIEACLNSAFLWQGIKSGKHSSRNESFLLENNRWVPHMLKTPLPKDLSTALTLQWAGLLYKAERSHKFSINFLNQQNEELNATAIPVFASVFYHAHQKKSIPEYTNLYLATIFERIRKKNNIKIQSPMDDPNQWLQFQKTMTLPSAFEELFVYLKTENSNDHKVIALKEQLILKESVIYDYFEYALNELSSLEDRVRKGFQAEKKSKNFPAEEDSNTHVEKNKLPPSKEDIESDFNTPNFFTEKDFENLKDKYKKIEYATMIYSLFAKDENGESKENAMTEDFKKLISIHKDISKLFYGKLSSEKLMKNIATIAGDFLYKFNFEENLFLVRDLQIFRKLKHISKEIAKLRQNINERFDSVDRDLENIQSLIKMGMEQNRENFKEIYQSLNKIASNTAFIKSLSIEGFQSTLAQPYELMEKQCFAQAFLEKTTENTIYQCLSSFSSRANTHAYNPIISGEIYEKDWEDVKIFYKDPTHLFGLLPFFFQKNNLPLRISKIPNPVEWAKGVLHYLRFSLKSQTELEEKTLNEMKLSGQKILIALEKLKEEELLKDILESYQKKLSNLLNVIEEERIRFQNENFAGVDIFQKPSSFIEMGLKLGILQKKNHIRIGQNILNGTEITYAKANRLLTLQMEKKVFLYSKSGKNLGIYRLYQGETTWMFNDCYDDDFCHENLSRLKRKLKKQIDEYVKEIPIKIDANKAAEVVQNGLIPLQEEILGHLKQKYNNQEWKTEKEAVDRMRSIFSFILATTALKGQQVVPSLEEIGKIFSTPTAYQNARSLLEKIQIKRSFLTSKPSFIHKVFFQLLAIKHWLY